MTVKWFIFTGLCFLLAACAMPEVATPAPTQTAILVRYPSALEPWANKLSNCAQGNPLVALYFTQSLDEKIGNFSDEITLLLGEPSPGNPSAFLAQVGSEEIVVIVNSQNDLGDLSVDQLRSIYSGHQTHWENPADSIQVWEPISTDPVRTIFEHTVLKDVESSSSAMLAPDISAMLEAVATDPGAIGYLPESALSGSISSILNQVKKIKLNADLEQALTQPVISLTAAEPHGLTRELLVCLESQAR